MEWNATWDDAQKKIKAITSLNPHVRFNWDGETLKWADNNTETIPTEAEIQAEIIRLQTEYDSQDYARKRKAEYDQLNQYEMMFDDKRDGTTTWVEKINEIKLRHPKNI